MGAARSRTYKGGKRITKYGTPSTVSNSVVIDSLSLPIGEIMNWFILSALFFTFATAAHAEPEYIDPEKIDPALSYKMSRDGWLWRWGDGHLLNGEYDEARKIWLETLGWASSSIAGIVIASIGAWNEKDGVIAAGSAASLIGTIGFVVERNRDISTAPIHAMIINAKFGGARHKIPTTEAPRRINRREMDEWVPDEKRGN